MALEKLWREIPPILITRDSPFFGGVAIDQKSLFRQRMQVVLSGDTLPDIIVEVKRVQDGVVYVGLVGEQNKSYIDVSAYTVALNSTIRAYEQVKAVLPEDDQDNDRYERGPVNADRAILVDKEGDFYDEKNPLPVKNETESGVKNPFISNIPLAVANTEYIVTIPPSAKKFLVKIRNGMAKMQLSYSTGQSNSNFITVEYANWYSENNLLLDTSLNLYVQTNKNNQILELLVWE